MSVHEGDNKQKNDNGYMPYPRYKSSGIEWLGKVPEHWEIKKSKYQFSEIDEKGFEDEELLSATQHKGVVPRDTLENRVWNPAISSLENYKLVKAGDFVISLRTFEGGIEFSEYRGLLSPAYTVLRAKNQIPVNFVRYYFKSDPYIVGLNTITTGIRQGKSISYSDFCELPLLLPEKHEAESISKFLDQETTRIDQLIEKQERLIELLKEKRTALISHAVTKGLDPDVEMKDSGFDWLGVIPVHWKQEKLKYLADIEYSNVDKHKNKDETEVKLCNYTDVYYEDRITNDLDFMKATADQREINKYNLLEGDVVITKDSETPDDIAVPAIVSEHLDNVICGYHLGIIRSKPDVIFSNYLFRSFQSKNIGKQMEIKAKGITRYGLGLSDLKNSLFCMPPLKEQELISDYIDHETHKIDQLVQKIHMNIEKLQEYRTSLISAAVTGKIDVRDQV